MTERAFDPAHPTGTEFLFLKQRNERIQRPLEHLGKLALRRGMAQQVLRVSKLLVSALAQSELNQILLRGRPRRELWVMIVTLVGIHRLGRGQRCQIGTSYMRRRM